MDPTLAATLRLYMAALLDGHTRGDDGKCTAGDGTDLVLVDGRQHLLDVIMSDIAEPDLAPHRVHVKGGAHAELDPVDVLDVKGKVTGAKQTGKVRTGPVDCPDCTRGLSSRGFDMICPRLPRTLDLHGCHDGCIVACGAEG